MDNDGLKFGDGRRCDLGCLCSDGTVTSHDRWSGTVCLVWCLRGLESFRFGWTLGETMRIGHIHDVGSERVVVVLGVSRGMGGTEVNVGKRPVLLLHCGLG